MAEKKIPHIYLIVEFDWPNPVEAEIARKAYRLHQVLQTTDWMKSAIAASHGVGKGSGSLWIFQLENYAALDRLLRDSSDPVYQAYDEFFSAMPVVSTTIREEVLFG